MIPINSKTLEFIKYHVDDDLPGLILKKRSDPTINYAFAFQQIASRQKIKIKLPEWSANFDLIFPSALSVEQASSQTSAIYKSTLFSGDHLIDLSAGFGVDAFYISKKFKQSTLVEPQEDLCNILQHNATVLNLKNIKIHNTDAQSFLNNFQVSPNEKITFYIDPDRRGQLGEKLIDIADCEPNILFIKDKLLQLGNQIIIKLSPMIDLKQLINSLPELTEIHIIAVSNECKEILAVLESYKKNEEVNIKTINITKKNSDIFEFQLFKEQESIPQLATELRAYLYEPNSAIMKSGGFKLIGNHYQLEKLSLNTHLYTSNQYIAQFPGRVFKIEDSLGFQKEELNKKLKKGASYNLTIRNFPMDINQLKKQIQIKDGGDTYLLATTMNQKHMIIICTKY